MSSRGSASVLAKELVQRLHSLPKFGAGIGLHRELFLLEELLGSAWYQGLDILRVTGSKGKGSVSAISAAILSRLGLRTGLFTSPHLFRFQERVQIDGVPVPDAALCAQAASVLDRVSAYQGLFPGDHVGAFEAIMAVAMKHFAGASVDTVVAEVGIGGRYDPVRVLPGRVVALTSVELEHTSLLGSSPELIAYDKADLCPAGGTIALGRVDEELLRRLGAYCGIRAVGLENITRMAKVSAIEYSAGRMQFSLECHGVDFGRLDTPLLGEHQAWNIAVAVLAVRRWIERNRPSISAEKWFQAVHTGVHSVVWPGRMEQIASEPPVVIDVGHTPHSMRAVAAATRSAYPAHKVLLVVGVSSDKDIDGVLRNILPIGDAVLCTRAYHNGAPAQQLAEVCERIRPGSVWLTADTIEQALDSARTRAAQDKMLILVTGGLFLAVEAAAVVRGLNPRDLHFF